MTWDKKLCACREQNPFFPPLFYLIMYNKLENEDKGHIMYLTEISARSRD